MPCYPRGPPVGNVWQVWGISETSLRGFDGQSEVLFDLGCGSIRSVVHVITQRRSIPWLTRSGERVSQRQLLKACTNMKRIKQPGTLYHVRVLHNNSIWIWPDKKYLSHPDIDRYFPITCGG